MLAKKTHQQGRIRWKDDAIPKVMQRLFAFYQQEIASPLRGMFYVLVSLNIIANTTQHYQGLDSASVAMSCSRVLRS